MTTSERSSFLSRWSRRKIDAREGVELPDEEPVVEQSSNIAEHPAVDTRSETLLAEPALGAEVPSREADTPLPTLQDVKALTQDSDFSPFVRGGVTPEVKNAALKKLFSDPHYNVMDRLDIYIDDYSNMEPLPESLLKRMASAHTLKMFESLTDDNEGRPDTAGSACEAREVGDGDNTQLAVDTELDSVTIADPVPQLEPANLDDIEAVPSPPSR